MQNCLNFLVKKNGLRRILRGTLFILVIILSLAVFPWVLRKQFNLFKRSTNTELWYTANPNISAYLGFNDETSCKNCRNATKICQSNAGDRKGEEVAYFISSYVENKNRRDAIRRTWGSATSLRPIFVMGIHSQESEMILARKEAEVYGDMIIENFADSFENSTLTTASILKHFKEFCENVSYLMKTEDEVLVNTDIVESIVRRHINDTQMITKDQRIIGYIYNGSRVVRNIRSHLYVGHSIYNHPKYPAYASGRGYLIPGSRVKEILAKSVEIPIIPIEDAYFTGLVASAIGLQHSADIRFNTQALKVKNYCAVKSQALILGPDPFTIFSLWSLLQAINPSVCFTFWNKLKLFT